MKPPGPFAFPKEARLATPRDFERVQREGRTFDLGLLVVRVAPRTDAPAGVVLRARLGLAVSRRVGGAVVRNRVKRRVRECFRRRQATLAGLDLVVTARPGAGDLPTADVDRHLRKLIERLGRTLEADA